MNNPVYTKPTLESAFKYEVWHNTEPRVVKAYVRLAIHGRGTTSTPAELTAELLGCLKHIESLGYGVVIDEAVCYPEE